MNPQFEGAVLVASWMDHIQLAELQLSEVSSYLQVVCTLGHLCDSNLCAAILLARFYEDACLEERSRLLHPEYYSSGYDNRSGYLMEHIFSDTSYLYPREDLLNALSLLETKRFVDITLEPDTDSFSYQVHKQNIEDALHTLLGPALQNRLTFQRELYGRKRYTRDTVLPDSGSEDTLLPDTNISISPIQQPTIEEEHNTRKEAKKVDFHVGRARALGLPATLALKEWIDTLDHFTWKCAYCETGAYDVFEHFVPTFHGGGTTQSNCVPACYSCNTRKRDLHPLTITGGLQEAIERVSLYLQSLIS